MPFLARSRVANVRAEDLACDISRISNTNNMSHQSNDIECQFHPHHTFAQPYNCGFAAYSDIFSSPQQRGFSMLQLLTKNDDTEPEI